MTLEQVIQILETEIEHNSRFNKSSVNAAISIWAYNQGKKEALTKALGLVKSITEQTKEFNPVTMNIYSLEELDAIQKLIYIELETRYDEAQQASMEVSQTEERT